MKYTIFICAIVCILALCLNAQTQQSKPDALLFADAYSSFLEGNYADAIGKFTSLTAQFPQSEFIDRTLFWKAWSHAELKNYGQAIALYEELIRKYPQSTYADDSLYKIGEIYENNLHQYDKSLDTYQRLINLFPSNPPPGDNFANNAISAQQQIADIKERQNRNFPQAINEWEKSQTMNTQIKRYGNQPSNYFNQRAQERINFIKNNSDYDYVPLTKFIEGESYLNDGNYASAINKFNELITQYPHSSLADNAAFNIAVCLLKQHNVEQAKTTLKKFLQDYPKSELSDSAKRLLH
jgi:TolA-binding protein